MTWHPARPIAALAVAHYGADSQRQQVAEECGELLAALSHHRRGRASTEDVAGEVADVLIVLMQVCVMLDLDDRTLARLVRERECRLHDRILEERDAG